MRFGRWTTGAVLSGWTILMGSGCVSLDQHRTLQARHRNVIAEKEQLAQELFDLRNGSGSLQTRVEALERELAAKDELVANLRSENELLDEMRQVAQGELEKMANRQNLSPIHINSPKLPEALDSKLKVFADEHPTSVAYDPARGAVKWKSDLVFAPGSDVVKQSTMESLRSFTEIIKSAAADAFDVIVVGHTDSTPIVKSKAKHPTNWHLSAHRAISVCHVLLQNGYSPERIGVMGYGEHRPIADNATKAGAAQNRRVEIYLVPRGAVASASAQDVGPSHSEAVAHVGLTK